MTREEIIALCQEEVGELKKALRRAKKPSDIACLAREIRRNLTLIAKLQGQILAEEIEKKIANQVNSITGRYKVHEYN
jgi:NTP pyrophosphatase (non-canonical NTP hydrolase)